MAVLPTILVFLSITTLISAGEITCDAKYKETLSKDGSGSKTGDLTQASSAKCLLELETSCQGCYVDVVFWKMELASPKPTQQSGSSFSAASGNAIIVHEQGEANVTIFQGNLTGTFFLTTAKMVKITYNGGSLKGEVNWNISYAVREIKHKSCYWGVNLRHTCPNNKCTDDPYECDRLTKHLDIPAAGITKETKTNIFMGIIGLLALFVIVFILVLYFRRFCKKKQNREKCYLCLTCRECLCKCGNKTKKRHNSRTSANSVPLEIIISAEDLLNEQQEAQDTTESQAEEKLQFHKDGASSDGYVKLKEKDDEA